MSEMNTYPPNTVRAVISRYSDAFVVARTINAVGDTIKTIGIVLGVILCVVGLLLASQGSAGMIVGIAAIVIAAGSGILFYLLGTGSCAMCGEERVA